MDFSRFLDIPELKISPAFNVISGLIFKALPAIPVSFPIRPPCFK